MHRTRLAKIGNSTGLTLPREVLAQAQLDRGDEIEIAVREGRIEITKADDEYHRAMEVGRKFAVRYRRAMAVLAK